MRLEMKVNLNKQIIFKQKENISKETKAKW